jgi:hypothetical protein
MRQVEVGKGSHEAILSSARQIVLRAVSPKNARFPRYDATCFIESFSRYSLTAGAAHRFSYAEADSALGSAGAKQSRVDWLAGSGKDGRIPGNHPRGPI